MNPKSDLNRFVYKTTALSLIIFLLLGGVLFFYLFPEIEKILIAQKKIMLHSITQIAVSVIEDQHQKAVNNQIDMEAAKHNALEMLRRYRYGKQKKDYFWVNDFHPRMLMHPYRTDLEGKDLTQYSDAKGVFLFRESVNVCKASGEGFINYMWQFKDDTAKVVPKLSYVTAFQPWGWIIGTGIYTQDIKNELKRIQHHFLEVSGMILLIIAMVQFFIIKRSKNIFSNKLDVEKAYEQSEEKYKSIVENIRIGVARTTPGGIGKFIELNSWFAKMLGYPKQTLKKIPVADLYVDNHKREVLSNKICQFDVVKNEELALYKKDGSTIIVTVSGQAIRDENGKVQFFDMIIEDITDEKQVQEEFLKNEKLLSIGTLAGGIAHDFNNILTGLYGNMALAKLELSPEDEAFQLIQDAEQSMTKATELTRQLLTFARGGDPIKEDLALAQIVKEAAHFNLSGSDIKLVLNFDALLWPVRADKEQINQVISTIVINARQAIPDSGSLKITAQNIDIKENEIRPLPPGKYVRIRVEDNGIGISKEFITKIFDPYFTTKQAGCGMGLATAYSILKKHNGLITVSSNLGKGTIFNIFLPAIDSGETTALSGKEKTGPDIKTAHILIMDDDVQICNIVEKMVTKFGFTATSAADGRQAIVSYRKAMEAGNGVDLILMDLTIPGGMGGKETIPKILEMDPNATAVVISGYSNDPVLSDYKDYGFKGRLVKPFKISDLKATLDKLLK